MNIIHFALLAAASLAPNVVASPVQSGLLFYTAINAKDTVLNRHHFHAHKSHHDRQNKRASDVYTTYTGDGETSWPDLSSWVSSFDEMFEANNGILRDACTQFNVSDNSDQEISDIGASINQVSTETGVDARFIFAIMLEESNGCVRAPTTNYGVRNPGLMQDHDGEATCNEGGTVQTPCPADAITQMIRDGVAGTAAGDGLVQTLSQAPGSGATKYYGAARIYNSGSIASSGNLDAGVASHCYASDVANRLTGWVFAQKVCTLDGTPPSAAAPDLVSNSPGPSSSPSTVTSGASSESVCFLTQPPATSSPEPSPAAKVTSSNTAPGVTTDCSQYYTVQDGDFCYAVAEKFGITFSELRQLNTQLDDTCSNLWKGYDYCVKGI